jgi:GT2 family glycosyltransferase
MPLAGAVNKDLSLVLVTHRSSAVAPGAIASFRADAGRIAAAAEVVIVDHSENENEEARLRELGPDRLLVLPNRGYATGVNAGVAATSGRTIFVGNPDITFERGSVGALLKALDDGWDIVGPQFALGGFLFPPADPQTPAEEVRRFLAARSRVVWARYFRRELERWRRVWDAQAPVGVPVLSGALLGFRRNTFERVGRWDEGYFLYFEETDWLRRAAHGGFRAAVVPRAIVAHQWAHVADPTSFVSVFEASQRRYLGKHFGCLGRLAAALPPLGKRVELPPLPDGGPAITNGNVLWLLSPSLLGFPAAGMQGGGSPPVEAMADFLAQHGRAQVLSLRAVDPGTGRLLGAWRWEPEER